MIALKELKSEREKKGEREREREDEREREKGGYGPRPSTLAVGDVTYRQHPFGTRWK